MGKGKGGMSKVRYVILTKETFEVIKRMINERPFKSEYIFASLKTKKPFTERRIDQIIKEVSKAADIDGVTTHIFRKSVTTHLLENEMPIEYVSQYLGHANLNTTTQNYADLDLVLHKNSKNSIVHCEKQNVRSCFVPFSWYHFPYQNQLVLFQNKRA